MGIYLSVASTDISLETGDGSDVRFVVGEMQGWRKNMEDAHVALTDLDTQCTSFPKKYSLFAVFDGHGGKEVARFAKLQFARLVEEQLILCGGDVEIALRESFHRIDELLQDPQYSDLLQELRLQPNPSDKLHEPSNKLSHSYGMKQPISERMKQKKQDFDDDNKIISTSEAVDMIREMLKQASHRGSIDGKCGKYASDKVAQKITSRSRDCDSNYPELSSNSILPNGYDCCGLTVTMYAEDNQDDTVGTEPTTQSIPATIKIQNSGSEEDKPYVMSNLNKMPKTEKRALDHIFLGSPILPPRFSPRSLSLRAAVNSFKGSPVTASHVASDGAMSCALKQHRLMAGCTAVAAMHIGNYLYVANAGDSRCVLCRENGLAFALSYDHKPQQAREFQRIFEAGGFVNSVGRVNGNLNLSRSLGDLKYKQIVQCSREDQIITAEPDITLTKLDAGDRFFILACDGIWDCLSNQQACDFVTERLDSGMSPVSITEELLHYCVAPDTTSAAGVGCDNMTFMLVILK